jgi:ABC-2 type transport system permease protein
VLGTLLLCFGLACWGYDPQRGFGALTKRGPGGAGS